MEFNDGYPSYETMALHDEEHGKSIRKVIWKVFWILLVVTVVELIVGFKAGDWKLNDLFLKVFFIGLTIVKAYYIVMSFMHLGEEEKPMKWVVLAPYLILVIYLVILTALGEGIYSKHRRTEMDPTIMKEAHSGAAHSEGAQH